jgi:hypothetical protein
VATMAEVLVFVILRRVGHPWYMCPNSSQP